MNIHLTVCGVQELPDHMGKPWTHVVSIWEKRYEQDRRRQEIVRRVAPGARHHFAFFEDTTDRHHPEAPRRDDIARILDFTRDLPSGAEVLVHCLAGISRSPAIAYAIVCQHTPPGQECAGLDYIRSMRPIIVPNELIVEWADQLLERQGRMTVHLGYD